MYLSEGSAAPLDSGGMRVLQQLHGVVHSWKRRKKVYDDQRRSSECSKASAVTVTSRKPQTPQLRVFSIVF